jgi:hypothetical protein
MNALRPAAYRFVVVAALDYQPFFIDRVEDAVSPGPQVPQIRQPVRERLRRPRLIGELPDSIGSAYRLHCLHETLCGD